MGYADMHKPRKTRMEPFPVSFFVVRAYVSRAGVVGGLIFPGLIKYEAFFMLSSGNKID